jgi:hypothetical protein
MGLEVFYIGRDTLVASRAVQSRPQSNFKAASAYADAN